MSLPVPAAPAARGADPVVVEASRRLDAWLEAHDFAGWDPHDALNSPIVRALTFGSRYLGIAWLQLVKRSPLNLRPLLRVPPGRNPKGMGLFLASYARRYERHGRPADGDRAVRFARWLAEHAAAGHPGAGWGYNFDWPNRGFFAPAGTPTVVNTAFNGLALLAASGPLRGVPDAPDTLALARRACTFVLEGLNRLEGEGELCVSYTPLDRRFIHNANVLAAQLLAEVGGATGEATLRDAALRAARFTARRQRADGSWAYGIGGNDGWVDNFHTAYVLVALRRVGRTAGTAEFDDVVRRGWDFWTERMFDDQGLPMYYPGRLHPIDVHAVAVAILAFLEFADSVPGAADRAWRLARWAADTMQDRRGFFHYQITRRYTIRIPYVRWSQAWMQRALTELAG